MKSVWRFIKWGALIFVIVLAVVSIYLYRNLDSQLKIFVQNKLSQQLPGFVTEIDSAQIVPSKGIVVRGISISVPGKPGKSEQILTIQEAFIACDVELQSLLSGNAKPTAIKLQKLTLYLTRNDTGQFYGWEQLQFLETTGESCPIEICESEVIYRDLRMPNAEPIWFTGLNFHLTPPSEESVNWDISGKLSYQKTGTLECQAKFSPRAQKLTLSGNAQKFIIDQEFLSYLSNLPDLTHFQKSLESFQAKIDFQFDATHDPLNNEHLPFATAFHIRGALYDGKITSPLIVKYPITDIRFGFDITHDSLQITDVTASSGESRLKLAWQQMGLLTVRQGKLEFRVEQYRFDDQFLPTLAPYLPQRLNDVLENFQAEGEANLFGIVHYNGQQWGIESAVIQLTKLAFTFAKFPYKLDNLHGTISIAPQEMQTQDGQRFFDEAMSIRLVTSDQKTAIEGTMYQILRGQPHGKIAITAYQVALNEKLMKAIPEKEQQEILESLNAEGQFDAKLDIMLPGRVKHDGEISPDLLLQVIPGNCTVRYDKFCLQLRNVRGNIEMQNGHWKFNNLHAENGSSMIDGKGHLVPTMSGGVDFRLDLFSKDLKLNDELIEAFQEKSHRQLLKDLNFSGRANDFRLTVKYLSDTKDFHIAFDAVTDPAVTKIKPKAFQLLMEDVTCNIHYADGKVVVDDFRGRKGNAFLSANLYCVFREDGSWVMNVGNLLAERFQHDDELLSAMPSDLRSFIKKLQITEPVTLRGMLCFQKDAADAATEAPVRSFWNMGIICHQNSAMLGVPLTNLCGKVDLLGKNDESGNTVFGKLELDSVNYGDYQLTNVNGPFSFHDDMIYLGRRSLLPGFTEPSNPYRQTSLSPMAEFAPMISQPVMTQTDASQFATVRSEPDLSDPFWLLSLTISPYREEQPIVASVYDGIFWLEGHVFLQPSMTYTPQAESSMRYNLQAGLREVNLERVTHETLADHPFKGKLSGDIQLEGGNSRDSMMGGGVLALREADIYKLPTMQRIMQFFGVRSRDDNLSAICSSNITFTLNGNRAILSDVRLDGNLLSLTGTGKIHDMEKMTISLELGTQLTTVTVEGSLKNGDLSVRTAPFGGLRQALQPQQDGQQTGYRPFRDFVQTARGVLRLN